jgi:hypothetical protein
MKKKEQILYILQELWVTNGTSTKQMTEFCMNRGIIKNENEFFPILEVMKENKWVNIIEISIYPIITETEFNKISFSSMTQTFLNGGSQDKMIYTTPNTPLR